MKQEFLIGQRVIVNGKEIGRITLPGSGYQTAQQARFEHWVETSRGIISSYADDNVKPLPGGQL